MLRPRTHAALAVSLLALAVSCTDDTSIFDDLVPPTATLDFPFDGALASGPALVFRGTAEDPSSVTSVTVDGVQANTSNGYADWDVSLNLPTGDLVVRVGTRDLYNFDPEAVVINMQRQGELLAPTALAFNPSTDQLVLTDVGYEGLTGLIPSLAFAQNLSGPGIGSGPALSDCTGIAVDGASGTAYVVDAGTPAVIAVNLSEGTRTVLSDAAMGAGVLLSAPVDVALDATGARLLVTDDGLDAVVAVELATGDRAVLSDAVTGAGPALTSPAGVAIDEAGGVLQVVDRAGALLSVDLTTGDRTAISDGVTGAGLAFGAPEFVDLDLAMDRAFVSDPALGAVLEVDLSTGDRAEVSGPVVGGGDPFQAIQDLWYEASTGRLLVLDRDAPSVVAVDAATGDRTPFYEFRRGTGERDPSLSAAAPAPSGTEAIFALDRSAARLFRVATPSGDRTVLGGAGPALVEPTDIRSLPPGGAAGLDGRLLVVDRGLSALLAVDPVSGDRTVVSDGAVGAGPAFSDPAGLAVDPAGAVAWVTDIGASTVVEVDLATGDRTVLSGGGAGSGPALDRPVRAVLEPADPPRLLVLDEGLLAVVGVQVGAGAGSGDRAILSDSVTGAGDPFLSFGAAALDAALSGLVVCDPVAGQVTSVDLASGDRSLLSGDEAGFGPRLLGPTGLAARVDGDGLYLVTGEGAALLLEPTTGDRVVLSL